ncbi:hypothetical protein Q5752_003865 [Cryptotrichosporon argae]
MAPSRGNADVDLLSFPTRLTHVLDAHQGPVHVVRYNHGAKYALTGGADRTIRLWNAGAGKEIKTYKGHGYEVLGLDIAHDNAKFASCGGDKAVFVWDVAAGTIIRRLHGHFGKLHAVAFSNDASVLCSAGFDAKIMIWDMRAASRDPLQTIKGAASSITSLAIPADSAEIVAASNDGHVRAYDVRMGRATDDLIGAPVHAAVPSPSSPKDTLLAATPRKLLLIDRQTGQALQTFTGYRAPPESSSSRLRPAFNRGEGSVLMGDDDGKVWAWNVLDAKVVGHVDAHKKAVTALEMNPNGKEMITASLDSTVKVWSK